MKTAGAIKMTLYRNRMNDRVRIVGIEGTASVRRMLSDLGIRLGDTVRITRNAPFGGPVLIERDSMELALGKEIAECILVEEAP
jgi:Fe2+ transport system protein FeoA